MRVRGTGQMLRTLSRVALIAIIGGGAAACSSDASRLSNPFSNPFDSEPAATGSLPDGSLKPAPVIRTGRIQSEALSPPSTPRAASAGNPAPTHAAAPATRVASTGPVGWNAQGGTQITVSQNDSLNQMSTRFGVPASAILAANGLTSASQITPGRQIVIPVYSASGMNPAAIPMTARPARAAEEKREDAKQLEAKVSSKREEAKEAAKEAAKDAAKREEAAKRAAAEKEADRKEALARDAAARKVADAKPRKEAALKEAEKPRHVRPGQVAKAETAKAETAKADEKKPDPKAAAKAKAEAKAMEAKAEAKAAAKEEAAQKLAEAKAAKEASQKAAAAEKTEKVAAKEAPKPSAAAAPAKTEPAATGSVAEAAASESFRWPAKGRVISGYGTSGNEGINIAVPEGTPVKAAEEGTVAYAGSDVKGYGKLVLVRHANGYVSAYAHNGELDVKPGDKVKRGQTIAKSGASGNVTSPQLHFEIRKGGAPVDPMSQLASN
jgi:murein DD-endopeptidase MepM/ murein hydrolase activator NlpD